jgi:hypothetical protein
MANKRPHPQVIQYATPALVRYSVPFANSRLLATVKLERCNQSYTVDGETIHCDSSNVLVSRTEEGVIKRYCGECFFRVAPKAKAKKTLADLMRLLHPLLERDPTFKQIPDPQPTRITRDYYGNIIWP